MSAGALDRQSWLLARGLGLQSGDQAPVLRGWEQYLGSAGAGTSAPSPGQERCLLQAASALKSCVMLLMLCASAEDTIPWRPVFKEH